MAQGDGRTIKQGQLPLRQENVRNVGATSEQGGMGKHWKCQSNVGARWDGKTLEMSEQSQSKVEWENVGAKSKQGGKENGIHILR